MNLFFETANQAQCFLAAVPIGFATAMGLDIGRREGIVRFLMDVLILAMSGLSLILLLLLLHEGAIRLYHLLGLGVGALLYINGVGKLMRLLRRRLQKRNEKKRINKQESEAERQNF